MAQGGPTQWRDQHPEKTGVASVAVDVDDVAALGGSEVEPEPQAPADAEPTTVNVADGDTAEAFFATAQ